jgi:predicted 3-demethylubiquinone-9 3-methyltransferase (glyoxalase superfamily)
MSTLRTISPCLWFDDQAEAAAAFYVSVFPRSRVVRTSRYTDEGKEVHGRSAGTVMTVDFEIDGLRMTALNGGPHFKFNEAISFQVMCETQAEIDRYWSALNAGGPDSGQCGWLKDKFGLSWQIVPMVMADLIGDADRTKASRVMKAMLKMKKLDIAVLEAAHKG